MSAAEERAAWMVAHPEAVSAEALRWARRILNRSSGEAREGVPEECQDCGYPNFHPFGRTGHASWCRAK